MAPSDSTQPLCWLGETHFAEHDSIVRQWLFDGQSLTRRLIALSENAFSVSPLVQHQAVLRDDECKILNLPTGSTGWVREVYLCGHDNPWVFARSVAPLTTLNTSELGLEGLGNRSLGELLFSDPAFNRSPLQACQYQQTLLPQAMQSPNLWARRSCFSQNDIHVLVTEVFLPAFWQRLKHAQ